MDEDMGKGLQIKEQDEVIGKNGNFRKLRYRKTANEKAHLPLEDDQFEDTLSSPKVSMVSTVPRRRI
jgi:hypothetical protein